MDQEVRHQPHLRRGEQTPRGSRWVSGEEFLTNVVQVSNLSV